MSPSIKYLIFQAVIIAPFAAGYLLKKRFQSPADTSRRIVSANLILVEPLIALWSIWGLRIGSGLAVLPLAGLGLVLLGFALGSLGAPALGLEGKRKATFIISASLANHGFTMGGFICYLMLGETGLGLSFIFISYFMLFIYLVIFPYARRASADGASPSPLSYLLDLKNMPLFAIIAAVVLSVAGVPRPRICFPSDLLLFISMASYYFSLGLNFSVSDIRGTLRESMALSLIKFALVPAAALLVVTVAGAPREVRAVILIQSFMPAAVYSVLSSVLFGLDTRLASGTFVISTLLFLTAVLPLVLILLPLVF